MNEINIVSSVFDFTLYLPRNKLRRSTINKTPGNIPVRASISSKVLCAELTIIPFVQALKLTLSPRPNQKFSSKIRIANCQILIRPEKVAFLEKIAVKVDKIVLCEKIIERLKQTYAAILTKEYSFPIFSFNPNRRMKIKKI